MSNPFGNPDTQNFDKQHLRWATNGDTKVRVHRLIWPLVNRILIGLDQMDGVDVTTARTDDTDPLHLRFHVDIPADKVEVVREALEPAKFNLDNEGTIYFDGTAEEAKELSESVGVEADKLTDDTDDEVADPTPDQVERVEPLGGSLEPGATGKLVDFIQFLMGMPNPSGVFDETTVEWLKAWQSSHWAPDTGELDADTWRSILPPRTKWLRPGATGLHVKVLQAALLADGYTNAPVSGVWGVRMSQAVRLFQNKNGLVMRERVSPLEWSVLFSPRPDSLEVSDSSLGENADSGAVTQTATA